MLGVLLQARAIQYFSSATSSDILLDFSQRADHRQPLEDSALSIKNFSLYLALGYNLSVCLSVR